ncbi:MAG: tyrosine-type recombinase/integrase [Leptospirales bacterium]
MEKTIDEAIKNFLFHCEFEKNLSPKTIKAYKIDLSQFSLYITKNHSNTLNIEDVDKDIIRYYVKNLFLSYKERSIRRKVNVIKAFFNFLERDEAVEKNPFRKLQIRIKQTKSLPKIIDLSIIESLLKYMYGEKTRLASHGAYSRFSLLRDVCIVELLFMTGARVSEIASLKTENISFKDSVIKIMGKGKRERMAHMFSAQLQAMVKEYDTMKNTLFPEQPHYFINRLGGRISEQSVRFMLRKYFRKAGINLHITPHMFRHTFATSLLEQGVDIRHIQELLGHSSILTTQIYTHVATASQCKILAAKHPRNGFSI